VAGLILPRVAEAAEVWRELARGESAREWGVRGDFSIGWVEGAGEFEFPSGKGYDRPHPGLLPQEKERNSPPHPDTTISLAEQPGVREEEERGGGWLYREKVTPPPALWIAGSGHVAQVVAPLALQLEFEVTVFDDRPELANHERFPAAARLRVGGWHELLQEPMPGQPAFGLIVTRGHQHDALVLSDWIHRPFVFLGMIGSRRKARVIREQFVRQKLATAEAMARVACPVGLDILAQSTAEIGVSIVGELVRKRAEWRRTSGG
jgi:xanthine dehydrogenase accessory factor